MIVHTSLLYSTTVRPPYTPSAAAPYIVRRYLATNAKAAHADPAKKKTATIGFGWYDLTMDHNPDKNGNEEKDTKCETKFISCNNRGSSQNKKRTYY
jgi:hypothetical protein